MGIRVSIKKGGNELATYFWCRHCGIPWNVSAKVEYAKDNYTCPRCKARLIRKVKSTQPTANR